MTPVTRLTPEREQQIREWSGPLTGTPWPEIWAELDAVRAELASGKQSLIAMLTNHEGERADLKRRLAQARERGDVLADDPEALARQFHEAYERLAPSFGYQTRKASAVPWADVPEQNKTLMIAVAGEVLSAWRELRAKT